MAATVRPRRLRSAGSQHDLVGKSEGHAGQAGAPASAVLCATLVAEIKYASAASPAIMLATLL